MTETNGTCRRLGLLACVSSLATAACAADVPVGHEMSLKLGDGDRIVLDTTAVSDTLPSVGADPILWIDASDTTGWEFDETTGKSFQGQAFPEFMQKIIAAGGLIPYINEG